MKKNPGILAFVPKSFEAAGYTWARGIASVATSQKTTSENGETRIVQINVETPAWRPEQNGRPANLGLILTKRLIGDIKNEDDAKPNKKVAARGLVITHERSGMAVARPTLPYPQVAAEILELKTLIDWTGNAESIRSQVKALRGEARKTLKQLVGGSSRD